MKAFPPVKNIYWPNYYNNFNYDKQQTIWKGLEGFLANTVQIIISFFWDLRNRHKKLFKETAIFPMRNKIVLSCPMIPRITDFKQLLLGWTISFGNHYATYKIISVTPQRLSKTQTFENKASLASGKNVFSYSFLVLSNMTNIKNHFIRVQKLVRQLLFML